MRPGNPVTFLRLVALVEGLSFLVLLFVAMPLKYLAGLPAAVKVAGWVHGVLFIVFCVALLSSAVAARWPVSRAGLLFVAALLPFGPFVVDGRMMRYEQEFRDRLAAG